MVLRVVDRGGQLVISLLLLRLVREAVGVKQLHQLPPELAHLGGFPGGEFLLHRQRRRRLRIFPLLLRARLPVFLRDLPSLFLALPHERFQILPAKPMTSRSRSRRWKCARSRANSRAFIASTFAFSIVKPASNSASRARAASTSARSRCNSGFT